jgi:hypothetical protein
MVGVDWGQLTPAIKKKKINKLINTEYASFDDVL